MFGGDADAGGVAAMTGSTGVLTLVASSTSQVPVSPFFNRQEGELREMVVSHRNFLRIEKRVWHRGELSRPIRAATFRGR